MARGGYRKPTNPAPVSGPGSLSQRTDGGPADTQAAKYISGLPYGEGQEMMNIQNSAPMAAAPSIEQSSMPSGLASAAASQPIQATPFNAPTAMPDVPVTDGADLGAGRGMEALALPSPQQLSQEDVNILKQWLPAMEFIAAQPGASQATINYLRKIRSLYGEYIRSNS